MKFDFHMHSVYSDGSSTIERIFHIAQELNLSGIAITDHDTVLGLENADKLSKRYGIPFVPAAEFTAFEQETKFHVLGYGIDYKSPDLIDYSQDIQNKLNERSKRQIKLMQDNGIGISKEEFFKEGQGGPLYRAKILKVLSRYGYLNEEDIMTSLKAYFAKGAPFYIQDDIKYPSFEEIVNLIKSNNGIIVLAHPGKIKGKSESLYWDIINSGLLDGVEVYHTANNIDIRKELINIAKEKELIITGGSDYHGHYNKYKTPMGGIELPEQVFKNLSPYLQNNII
ncbi:MAG: PHP domain-containing protein [Clostridium sp.]|uniref:PHP domain-containing protein n=1 Tax=Clostridium sp. TaxID=1506 RepID=UPI003D6D7AA0